MSVSHQGRFRAPELKGGRGWLNTDKPLSLEALRGKVVLLDFWTYGCINCIHIIPDLKELEAKYSDSLVVIGVHSAKFDNEKETDNIRRIILRYEIEHSVVNDADFVIWRSYGVSAWPTQYLIDPMGYVLGFVSGEGNYEVLDQTISETIEESRRRGILDERPLSLTLERAKVGDLPLAFPGKVLANEEAGRLFIADSNHNRVVVADLDGTVVVTIGTGAHGAEDGEFDKASFYRPQGLALDGKVLYIADTENHLIRRADLKTRRVGTIAGTGEKMKVYGQRGQARSVPLNSPWDLQLVGRTLYIAMAGPHQIWKLDLENQEVSTFAGSGYEARRDGEHLRVGFAQPSGLATDSRRLYVADSESNIIRAIGLTQTNSAVYTLAGGDLFKFGDKDGVGDSVRLQHPLGLAFADSKVLIADTYNHKIKGLDPQTRAVKTLFGTGEPGQEDGARATFYEPGGISVAGGKLYVADTNNHAVRVVNLEIGETATLKLRGLTPPAPSSAEAAVTLPAPNVEDVTLAPQPLRAQSKGALVVYLTLPAGFHLNPSAPQRYQVSLEAGSQHVSLGGDETPIAERVAGELRPPLSIPLNVMATGEALLRIQLTIYYCREDDTGTCAIKTLVLRVPVRVTTDDNAPREIKAEGKVEPQ
jgi:thiol-disulfide isomerase/thioredoxin